MRKSGARFPSRAPRNTRSAEVSGFSDDRRNGGIRGPSKLFVQPPGHEGLDARVSSRGVVAPRPTHTRSHECEAQRSLTSLVVEVSAGKVTSSATLREYRRTVTKRIEPDLGKLPLRKVTTQRLDAYDASLIREHDLSPASVRRASACTTSATFTPRNCSPRAYRFEPSADGYDTRTLRPR